MEIQFIDLMPHCYNERFNCVLPVDVTLARNGQFLQISLQGNAPYALLFSNMEPNCSHLLAQDFLLSAKSHPPPTRCRVLRVSEVYPQQSQCALNRNDPLQEIQGEWNTTEWSQIGDQSI